MERKILSDKVFSGVKFYCHHFAIGQFNNGSALNYSISSSRLNRSIAVVNYVKRTPKKHIKRICRQCGNWAPISIDRLNNNSKRHDLFRWNVKCAHFSHKLSDCWVHAVKICEIYTEKIIELRMEIRKFIGFTYHLALINRQ